MSQDGDGFFSTIKNAFTGIKFKEWFGKKDKIFTEKTILKDIKQEVDYSGDVPKARFELGIEKRVFKDIKNSEPVFSKQEERIIDGLGYSRDGLFAALSAGAKIPKVLAFALAAKIATPLTVLEIWKDKEKEGLPKATITSVAGTAAAIAFTTLIPVVGIPAVLGIAALGAGLGWGVGKALDEVIPDKFVSKIRNYIEENKRGKSSFDIFSQEKYQTPMPFFGPQGSVDPYFDRPSLGESWEDWGDGRIPLPGSKLPRRKPDTSKSSPDIMQMLKSAMGIASGISKIMGVFKKKKDIRPPQGKPTVRTLQANDPVRSMIHPYMSGEYKGELGTANSAMIQSIVEDDSINIIETIPAPVVHKEKLPGWMSTLRNISNVILGVNDIVGGALSIKGGMPKGNSGGVGKDIKEMQLNKNIVTKHTGGKVPGRGEVLAVLKGGETIRTEPQEQELQGDLLKEHLEKYAPLVCGQGEQNGQQQQQGDNNSYEKRSDKTPVLMNKTRYDEEMIIGIVADAWKTNRSGFRRIMQRS